MLAEVWGIPPWEVLGQAPTKRDRLLWYLRWKEVATLRAALSEGK